MNTGRYVIALIIFVSFPPAVLFWFVVHPFIDFWRRLGAAKTYLIAFSMFLEMLYGLFLVAGPFLATEFGTNYYLWPFALVSYGVSARIEVACRKHLKLKTLFGVPELAADGAGGSLLSEGIYARVCHPRYLGAVFGLVAFALFTNYLAIYLMVPVVTAIIYPLTVIEERELVERFGDDYREYRKRVPRLIPIRG